MPALAAALTRPEMRTVAASRVAGALRWLLGFALVLYLTLRGGGYDPIVRDQVGVALWWLLLFGAAAGTLPAARLTTRGRIALALLVGLAAWTALGLTWTESTERTGLELARLATYSGALALGLSALGGRCGRQLLDGVAAAIAAVAWLALLSRLHPAWFPANQTATFLTSTNNRLSYPINYWNGLAALMALGLPLLLSVAARARTLAVQALAAATLPVLALCVFLTASRGGVIACAIAVVAFLAASSDRLPRLATVAAAGAGSALLIAAAHQRPILLHVLPPSGQHTADGFVPVLAACAIGVGALQIGIGLAARHLTRPALGQRVRRRLSVTAVAVVAVAVVVALAANVPGTVAHQWESFKDPNLKIAAAAGNEVSRLDTVSGNGRYQYWDTSVQEAKKKPLHGAGPGTFEYVWARSGPLAGFVRDAHSLYFQTLAEIGVVGLLLILGLVGGVIAAGGAALRTYPERRPELAGAFAAACAFAFSALVDWVWQVPAIPVAFLLCAAVLLDARSPRLEPAAPASRGGRVVLALLAVVALVVLTISLSGESALRRSHEAASASRLSAALTDARTAQRVAPYAASPRLQEALVLEEAGELNGAVLAARVATTKEPTNWRTWLVLSRIEAERGHITASVRAFRRARALNPRSTLFAS